MFYFRNNKLGVVASTIAVVPKLQLEDYWNQKLLGLRPTHATARSCVSTTKDKWQINDRQNVPRKAKYQIMQPCMQLVYRIHLYVITLIKTVLEASGMEPWFCT